MPDQLYGVVTTGTTWVFLRFKEAKVEFHHIGPFQISPSPLTTEEEKDQLHKEIDTLFSYILAIFQQAKGSQRKRLKGAESRVDLAT